MDEKKMIILLEVLVQTIKDLRTDLYFEKSRTKMLEEQLAAKEKENG
jgi:hypothetical protein